MEFFAKSGSLCNAYTTFRNTSYLFYATKDLKENIEYLLNYVQNIYLTEDDVEKEKGIISEEIHMYEDRPGDVLFEKVRLIHLILVHIVIVLLVLLKILKVLLKRT